VEILGVLGYSIDPTFATKADRLAGKRSGYEMKEELIAAIPVDKEAHTCDNIEKSLKDAFVEVGIHVEETGMGVFDATSDNGSNMLSGMEAVGDGAGDCASHTAERSAALFYKEAGCEVVLNKVKGMTRHLHTIGGAHMKDFHDCQTEYRLPLRKPQVSFSACFVLWFLLLCALLSAAFCFAFCGFLHCCLLSACLPVAVLPTPSINRQYLNICRMQSTGNACRWHFDQDQWGFFGDYQRPVQLYDVQFDRRDGCLQRPSGQGVNLFDSTWRVGGSHSSPPRSW